MNEMKDLIRQLQILEDTVSVLMKNRISPEKIHESTDSQTLEYQIKELISQNEILHKQLEHYTNSIKNIENKLSQILNKFENKLNSKSNNQS